MNVILRGNNLMLINSISTGSYLRPIWEWNSKIYPPYNFMKFYIQVQSDLSIFGGNRTAGDF